MIKWIGFILMMMCLFCMSCANIQGLSGGPEDKTAPMLADQNSSPNFQTNFKQREIVLGFDEWIKMDNPTANISISPPTEFPVKYKLKGKRIFILFDGREVLKENTTYTIQFGESIKDITNGNIQRSLRYVFSTGDYLDSLKISGKVIDAFTKKPKEKILVSLYKNQYDSAFQKTKPFYFEWTDTSGRFTIQNISPGDYRLYALEDKNQNYFYDQTNEAFAFYPVPVQINASTTDEFLLNLSTKSIPAIIKQRLIHPGETRLYFNEKQYDLLLNCDSPDSIRFLNLKDSLLIWNFTNQVVNCILKFEKTSDTFNIQPLLMRLTDTVRILKMESQVLKPGEQPTFIMNYPILTVIKDSIKSIDSFSVVTGIKMDSIDLRKFYLEGSFTNVDLNQILIPEYTVQGLHNTANRRDTFTFRFLQKASLSRLNLSLEALQKGVPYIFQLLNGDYVSNELNFVSTESNKKLLFNGLLPGKYRVRIIHDINRNGKWDPSDFVNKIPSESIWYFDLPDLRADWDVDVSLKL